MKILTRKNSIFGHFSGSEKMESKDKALKVASNENAHQQLVIIGKHHLGYEMMKHEEEFLLEYNGSKESLWRGDCNIQVTEVAVQMCC